MLNPINLNKYGEDHPILFYTDRYSENNNLYVGMVTMEDGYPEPYGDITVNLGIKCAKDCGFVDVNNNGDEIVDWLMEHKIAMPLGKIAKSGFVTYPEMKFNIEIIKNHSYKGWV